MHDRGEMGDARRVTRRATAAGAFGWASLPYQRLGMAKRRGASNMPFYQTNPPIFEGFFYGNGYE
jgi:hypothetical protein